MCLRPSHRSRYFSYAVSTPANRQTFVSNIIAVYNQYELDGIDIDWEYPGRGGESSHGVSPADSENMLLFLQQLRSALPKDAIITTTAQMVVITGPNGHPLKNASSFAQVLDWVMLMNYDDFESE